MTPDQMAALHAAAFSDQRPWTAAEFAQLLASPGAILWGDARSFTLGRVILDEAEVLTVATAPEFRRQGLGTISLNHFESAAANAGATSAFLEVATSNSAAITLYQKQNYTQVGLRQNYYRLTSGQSVDALVMKKAFHQD